MLYALILAGGKGLRLYPLSRSSNPKQFLKITNDKSFLRNTVDRIKPIVNKENIYVVTNEEYLEQIYEELPEVDKSNIFIEPANKETALCTISVKYLDTKISEPKISILVIGQGSKAILRKSKDYL